MKNVIQGTTLSGTGAVTIAPGAEITIRNPAGQLVPLWADRAGTQPHDNPFLTDSEGNFRVYADSGWVHVRAQKDGSVREWRYVPLGSAAAMDIGEVYAALGSEVYSSVSEGLSNSAEGDFFLVESGGALDLYRVVNGVAEQRATGIDDNVILATRAYADGVAAEAESNATNAAVAAASAAYQQATEYSDSQLQTHRESGDHDHRYYTKTEVDQALSTKVDDSDPRLSDARDWIAPMVTQAEVEGGVSTEPRKWSVEMVKLAAETYGGIGSEIIGPGPDQVPTNEMLGTAATRDVTTSPTDTTEGRVLKVGDGGWLGRASASSYISGYPESLAQNVSQVYRREEVDGPVGAYAASIHFAAHDTWGRLRIAYRGDTRRAWIQGGLAPSGSGWTEELYHTGNLPPLIGVGQTWQNVTSSRSVGTTYTNTTGRPIFVAAADSLGANASVSQMRLYVDNKEVSLFLVGPPSSGGEMVKRITVSGIVPPGSVYRIELIPDGGKELSWWMELR